MPTNNLRAIGLMVIAMVGFAIGDTLIKLSSLGGTDGASAGQILVVQGVFGTLIFGTLMWRSGERLTKALVSDWLVIGRSISDIVAATCFITALTLMPVGNASAILQVQPIVVTLAAVLFLGEQVGWRRWLAIGIGFIGVIVVIRPGLDGFNPASGFVLAAVISLSVRDLLTRVLDPVHSTQSVAFLVSALLIPFGALVHFMSGADHGVAALPAAYLVVSTVFVMGAYYSLTQSLRIGEISAVAPYRYSRLVAAFIAAFVLLGERPDNLTIIGSALVILAGLMVLRGQTQRPPHQEVV